MTRERAGQPTKYTEAISEEICKRIMSGLSVHKICEAEDMPPRSTLNGWLSQQEEFSYRYAAALEFRTHLHAERRHEIIDDAFKGLETLPEGINQSVWGNLIKEKIRAIEWDAERMAGRRYTTKIENDNVQDIHINIDPKALGLE